MRRKCNELILMYHSVGNRSSFKEPGAELYNVTLEDFRRQMGYIYHNRLKARVTLTFDDGDLTNHTNTFPVLREYGFTGYFFIIAGFVGRQGYMNWSQLKELKDAGMVIGSHGMTHRIFTKLSDSEVEAELKDSKRILEEGLGGGVECISIPRGFCNSRIIQQAKESGYKSIFTSESRVAVKRSLDLNRFIRMVNGRPLLKEAVESAFKGISRRVLGVENYDRLRTRILR